SPFFPISPFFSPFSQLPVDDPIISQDEVIFPLTVALDRLPPGTAKAKIVVTVWQRDTEPAELQEGTGTEPGQVTMTGQGPGGSLRLLQGRAPGQVFRQQHGAFKAQGEVPKCPQMLNGSSQEELSLWDVQVLPNFNASYLPVMPDGSVLLVDDVCHHSGEVPVGAFCRVPGCHSGWPCPLSALEEQNFLFQLQAPERPPRDAKEGLEVPLVAVVRWSTPKLPFTNSIVTHYRATTSPELSGSSLGLSRDATTMSLISPRCPQALQTLLVAQSHLSMCHHLIVPKTQKNPPKFPKRPKTSGIFLNFPEPSGIAGKSRGSLDSVVCHTPLTNLGYSRKGSARTFRVAFQALRAGLFEVRQRHGAQGHHPGVTLGVTQVTLRSGSVMERRAITPPVGSPVGRPLYLPAGDKAVLALDKIAKRECKVLVVPPVK
ncbi:microtubule-associated protein 11, partial [Geospiza fortis]|uniref:Microtubule-associated protein 11 n=1 Tax=Geospiza fortis TaxID=48883 RepID=A0A8N5F0H4_GEOFO